MPIVNGCCICFELRKGCIYILVLSLLSDLLGIAVALLLKKTGEEELAKDLEEIKKKNLIGPAEALLVELTKEVYKPMFTKVALLLAIYVIGLIGDIIGIVGFKSGRLPMILTYVILNIISSLGSTMMAISIVRSAPKLDQVNLPVSQCVKSIITIYFSVVMYSYYQTLQLPSEQQDPEGHPMEPTERRSEHFSERRSVHQSQSATAPPAHAPPDAHHA